MNITIFPKRFALLKGIIVTYIIFAFIIRVTLYVMSFSYIDFSIINLIKVFGIGLLFDVGSLSYIAAFYSLYLLIMPKKWFGSLVDKSILYFTYVLLLLVLSFSFLAEIPFWDEYQRRFNFIAIDYLLYTYEVVENINQSYPLPLIITILFVITFAAFFIARRKKIFKRTFSGQTSFTSRLLIAGICLSVLGVFHYNVENVQAEVFPSLSENELAKSGVYSFFAAFNTNELDYNEFYKTLEIDQAYNLVRESLSRDSSLVVNDQNCIKRYIKNEGEELLPNVIFVGMESLNAAYLNRFGNTKYVTTAINEIHKESVAFTNMYATGTRTIRGLEAVSLAIPPTPGRSIVKRPNNENLFTIGEVFRQKGYTRTFITGGDGFFDNMANYFSNNGFDIVDRQKGFRGEDELPTKRINIRDEQVTFENAWGACDGDIYNVVLDKADKDSKSEKPFFYMFMTNSNHKPYTYPEGIVDIKPGTNRTGAIKYANAAFKEFIKNAKDKPWFKNTVFVISSDHCAYSAGRTEINVKSHHIPGMIYNLPNQQPHEIDKLCSQIDLFPTLFGYLNWSYTSKLFGKDIAKMEEKDERAFIGNHRKVGLLKKDKLVILETQKKHVFYNWKKKENVIEPSETDEKMLNEAVSYYQTAYDLFKNGGLKADM